MAKVALLIGVSEYEQDLKPLPAAPKDVEAMQWVLQNTEIGSFDEVKPLLNPDPEAMRVEIETMFKGRKKDDLVLLFFSGHGIKDDSGKLYFATRTTRQSMFKSTAVPASFVHEIMDDCRSRRQVFILDCCFSGAFAKGLSAKDDGSVEIMQQLGGEGRVVLTSSTSTQYSFEQQGADLSIYTRHLVEGIKTGAADRDGDGCISVDELHEYAKEKVQQAAPTMQPELYAVKEGFKIWLAKAPIGDPKLKYRKKAEELAHPGEFSRVAHRILNRLRIQLGLQDKEADDIEAEVLRPYREYQEKLQEYEEALVEAIEDGYPLRENIVNHLKDYQRMLGLRDEDVALIESRIISERGLSSTNQTLSVGLETISVEKSSPSTQFVLVTPLTNELSSNLGVDYTRLRDLLQTENWQEADQETKFIMLELCDRKQEGRLETNNLRTFPCPDLRTIDQLWVKYSNERFGFSVQQHIWQSIGGNKGADKEIWWRFGDRVGWRAGDEWIAYKDLTFTLKASQGHLPYCRAWIEWGWPKHIVGRFDSLASRLVNCNSQ
jgi:hypothetical protein